MKTYASDIARIAATGTGDVAVSGHPPCTVRKIGVGNVDCR